MGRCKTLKEDAAVANHGKSVIDYLPEATAFLLETAVAMYVENGHSQQEAEKLAKTLLESQVEFKLPTVG